MAKVRTSKVLARYGVWRVHELDWEKHIGMKTWCSGVGLMYFAMALADARQRFPREQKTSAVMAEGSGK